MINRAIKTFASKKLWAIVAVVMAVVFVPYIWSRVSSIGNRILVVESSAESGPAFEHSFRVACYNIAHGRGLAESNWDGGDAETRLKRLDDIADLLKALDADVVVLNEVDFDASWSNNVNQAKYIAEKASYPFRVEERNLDFRVLHRTWRFGNAILSKYPVSNSKVIDLPSFAGIETALAGKKRGVMCDVNFGGDVVSVIGLHLSHRSEHVREVSARKVIELVKANSNPCIVMGDMNSTPPGYPQSNSTNDNRNAIAAFDSSGQLQRSHSDGGLEKHEFTYRADNPKSIIDWILVSESLKMTSYEVIDSMLSDHRPVVAEVELAE